MRYNLYSARNMVHLIANKKYCTTYIQHEIRGVL